MQTLVHIPCNGLLTAAGYERISNRSFSRSLRWATLLRYIFKSMALSYSPEPEPPFRPREKIVEKQRLFQSVRKPTYLEGRYDVVTSVAIPLALAASSMFLVVS